MIGEPKVYLRLLYGDTERKITAYARVDYGTRQVTVSKNLDWTDVPLDQVLEAVRDEISKEAYKAAAEALVIALNNQEEV